MREIELKNLKIQEEIQLNELSVEENVSVGELETSVEKGVDGLSAYEIAVKNGYEGTEEEWLNSLKAEEKKEIVVVDVTEIITTQDNAKFIELSQRYLNGEIVIVATLEIDELSGVAYAIITGVSELAENIYAWSLTSASWGIEEMGSLDHANIAILGMTNAKGYIEYGIGTYEISEFVRELEMEEYVYNNLSDVKRTAERAETIAKGANRAISFDDYVAMFNNIVLYSDNTAFSVGQTIYIRKLDVPDLWVSTIYEDANTDPNMTEADMVNALKTYGKVRIGFYELSPLETQKVNLNDYIPKINGDTVDKRVVVRNTDGTYLGYPLAQSPSRAYAGTVAMHTDDKYITSEPHASVPTKTPTVDYASANKKYVDDNFVAKKPTPQSGSYVYAFDPKGERTQRYTPANVVSSLVQRRDDNTFDCGEPIDGENVTNKNYVDNLPDNLTEEQKLKWQEMFGAGGETTDKMPTIRFVNASKTRTYQEYSDSFVEGESDSDEIDENYPLIFSVEVLSGKLQVGDQLQLCRRKRFTYKKQGKPDKYKLQKFDEYIVTEEDLKSKIITVHATSEKALLRSPWRGDKYPRYIRIRRAEYNEDGEDIGGTFSNAVPFTVFKSKTSGISVR